MNRLTTWRIGALTVMALALSGCTAISPPAYSELSEAPTDEDLLPIGLGDGLDIEEDSVRLVGEYDGASFYLAKYGNPNMDAGICILVSADNADVGDGAACGDGPFRSMWPRWGTARYVRTPMVESELKAGWILISENLKFHPTVQELP